MTRTDTTGFAEIVELAADVSSIADELDAREPLAPAERIAAWHHIVTARDALNVVIAQMAADALDAMRQLGVTEASTDIGPVHVGKGYAREEWRGHDLIGRMGRRLVDPDTGEVSHAVAVETLRAVLPGCSDPGHTSSKWKITGLREVIDDWFRYREREEAPDVIKTGKPPRY